LNEIYWARAVPMKYEKILLLLLLLFPRSVRNGRRRSKRPGCENNFAEKGNGEGRAAWRGECQLFEKALIAQFALYIIHNNMRVLQCACKQHRSAAVLNII